MTIFGKKDGPAFKYPGKRMAMDGNSAVIMVARDVGDAAGAFPITPSTDMGENWAQEAANGYLSVAGRPLIFVQPEGEHAAAAVTAGLAMSGLRAGNFSSSQGIAYMHESLYAAVGKRLPYVLNIATRAITKATLNVHCGHDDYHCMDDTGFIQVFGKSAQEAADLNVIGRKIAELALTPIAVAQDGFLTSHLIEPLNVPERELIAEYLGRPDDLIDTPTPAQRMLYGETRRRVPELWSVDRPLMSGTVQNQDSYMQAVAAQRPYFFDHVAEFAERCMEEWHVLTGRRYRRVSLGGIADADYLLIGQGSIVVAAEAVADYLYKTRQLKLGVVNLTMFRPFPGDLLGHIVKGKKGVLVLERTDQPLAEDLPLIREIRATIAKCLENGNAGQDAAPFPKYAAYKKTGDAPLLYSGCFGLGSRDLQPGDVIAAVDNMLPGGKKRKFFYLGIEFVRDNAYTPQQELHMQQVEDAYPGIRDLALKRTENPNLMPERSITVRMHSVGGWGAITTGKNLAMTLFDLLDFDIKANPKYGSEKKGQPTTYYLSAAPEPIRLNCEYHHVDVVLSPDPNVFTHSNPLFGLKAGGTFIIQSSLGSAEAVWRSFPKVAQQLIVDNHIRLFYIDGFKIAREEASDPELQFRMQGNAFQGAFFSASPIAANAGKTPEQVLQAIYDNLQAKFGYKGKQVVEDNFRTVKRGFDETHEIPDALKIVGNVAAGAEKKPLSVPTLVKDKPVNADPLSDIHRFWEQTGSFYAGGKGNDNLADPFAALSVMPAASGLFRDMTQVRFEHPRWIPENCTACGNCYTICPDSAIPGLVNTVGEVLETALQRVEKSGNSVKHLRRALRSVEKKLHQLTAGKSQGADLHPLFDKAIGDTVAEHQPVAERDALREELQWLKDALGTFKFALTKPYHDAVNKRSPNSGGLFSITVNPYTCKGCMECVEVCGDAALETVPQTPESIATMRSDWEFWVDLPTTNPQYKRIDDLDEKSGALTTLLLHKQNYAAMNCGDGACLGCGEKTIVHLFVATVTALMQPRVQKHLAHLDDLIAGMEQHLRMKLAATLDIGDSAALDQAIAANRNGDLTLARLSAALDQGHATHPIDPQWLHWASQLLAQLKHLKWQYAEGVTGEGRASLGMANSTGCSSVWGSTYPYNPYPFPWANNLFQDSPSLAMGLFEGHMVKMAEGFKAVRMAELELAGKYDRDAHGKFFAYFDWRQFSAEEYRLCPPVVSLGGDGAMYDIGFQNLSRCLMSGMPIKVLILDTQAYSNTGGQACTSGFSGQIADMSPYGTMKKGKQEIRKEMALIAMAHRTAYVMQGSTCNVNHLLDGYIDGLNYRGPAVFNVYSACMPEHGIADNAAKAQNKLAVEARGYPLLVHNPSLSKTWKACTSLKGNPDSGKDWTSYTLRYVDEYGIEGAMQLPLTFADWALSEGRFRKHFKTVPRAAWNDNMAELAAFIDMGEAERDGKFPFVWAIDAQDNTLQRMLVSGEIVAATLERRDYWRLLQSLVGIGEAKADLEGVAAQAKAEMAQSLVANLLKMAGSDVGAMAAALASAPSAAATPDKVPAPAAAAGYEPVWVETPQCTSCDECVTIAPGVFKYNAEKKSTVANPKGGSYEDIVKAAEKCTASVIHPGTPWNPDEPNLEKLLKRAEKFQ